MTDIAGSSTTTDAGRRGPLPSRAILGNLRLVVKLPLLVTGVALLAACVVSACAQPSLSVRYAALFVQSLRSSASLLHSAQCRQAARAAWTSTSGASH